MKVLFPEINVAYEYRCLNGVRETPSIKKSTTVIGLEKDRLPTPLAHLFLFYERVSDQCYALFNLNSTSPPNVSRVSLAMEHCFRGRYIPGSFPHSDASIKLNASDRDPSLVLSYAVSPPAHGYFLTFAPSVPLLYPTSDPVFSRTRLFHSAIETLVNAIICPATQGQLDLRI